MSEADYYAPGSYLDPRAPWNEPSVPEKEFEVACSQSLSKITTVVTTDYIPGASGVDYEPDGEGGCCAVSWEEDPDTSNTDWSKEYKSQHLTPLELINKLKSLLLDIDSDALKSNPCYQHKQYYIDECSDWIEDETVVVKE